MSLISNHLSQKLSASTGTSSLVPFLSLIIQNTDNEDYKFRDCNANVLNLMFHLQPTFFIMSRSLEFHDLFTYVLKIYLLSLVWGSFQFVPQSSVGLPSFIVFIPPLPLFTHFIDHFLCNPYDSKTTVL